MAQKSGIPYCDSTCNGTAGCSQEPCSPGCHHCWALPMTHRMAHNPALGDRYQGLTTKGPDGRLQWTGEVRVFNDVIEEPLHWRKGRSIFWCSMSDIAMSGVRALDRMFAVMALTPQHTHLVVTKRIEDLRSYLTHTDQMSGKRELEVKGRAWEILGRHRRVSDAGMQAPWPLPNVWIILTACTQEELDEKGPVLLDTPAAHRGLSIEPALERIHIPEEMLTPRCIRCGEAYMDADGDWAWPGGELHPIHWCYGHGHEGTAPTTAEARSPVEVVILGCESGPGARWPSREDWDETVRSARCVCDTCGVDLLLKQSPDWYNGSCVRALPLFDGRQHLALPWRANG